jgi:NAD(P)H-dependent FMN reductase
MKTIFVINGSASDNSSNHRLIDKLASLSQDFFSLTVFNDLKTLPHFDPALSADNAPEAVRAFRHHIEAADGIIICTPEYVFSIPGGLKNAIEWCVATTVFSGKPAGLITASASGVKGHEELQLIMKTLGAVFTPDTTLLIQGIKSKVNEQGRITDVKTEGELVKFIDAFRALTESSGR